MSKGKCFSACNKGQRKESDFYETPYSMTQQLLDSFKSINVLKNCNNVLEPARGNGAIVRVLEKNNIPTYSYDMKDGYDFLKEENQYDYIITNPPYSLAKEFILKASRICRFYFFFLLPLIYLHGKERYDLFYARGFLHNISVFTRYPMLGEPLREDGKYRTGMIAYAWFQFYGSYFSGKIESIYKSEPTITWFDNQKYILKAGEK